MIKLFKPHKGSPIRPRGQDTVEAFREWAKDEIKSGVERAYDLGKFLFTVSSATIGLLVGFSKAFSVEPTKASVAFAILVLTGSIGIALWMVIPRIWVLRPQTDLAQEYADIITLSRIQLWLWTALWGIGVVCILWALFGDQVMAAMCSNQPVQLTAENCGG